MCIRDSIWKMENIINYETDWIHTRQLISERVVKNHFCRLDTIKINISTDCSVARLIVRLLLDYYSYCRFNVVTIILHLLLAAIIAKSFCAVDITAHSSQFHSPPYDN